MNLIEIQYKTDSNFKWFVDDAVETMWSDAIHNDDTEDTWHSFCIASDYSPCPDVN